MSKGWEEEGWKGRGGEAIWEGVKQGWKWRGGGGWEKMCAGRGGLIGAKESGRGEVERRGGEEGGWKGEAVGLRLETTVRGGNDSGERPSGLAQWIGFTGKPGGELGDFRVGFGAKTFPPSSSSSSCRFPRFWLGCDALPWYLGCLPLGPPSSLFPSKLPLP